MKTIWHFEKVGDQEINNYKMLLEAEDIFLISVQKKWIGSLTRDDNGLVWANAISF